MAQMSLYMDETTLHRVEQAARMSHTSVSRWVRTTLREALDNRWPTGYFALYGSVEDDSFTAPEEIPFQKDVSRDTL